METPVRFVFVAAIALAVPLIRLLPERAGNWAVATLFFAAILWQAPGPAILMAGCALAAWMGGRRQVTGWRLAGVAVLVSAYLIVIKYVVVAFLGDWILRNAGQTADIHFVVPLGLSFLTFRLLDYLFTSASGRMPAHRADSYALFVVFLPIFAAGPIQRFDRFLSGRSPAPFAEDAKAAAGRLLSGMIKAFALPALLLTLAGHPGPQSLFQTLTDTLDAQAAWQVWAALWVMVIYYYLNFAGYCDLAIGAGRLMGFRIDENFDAPFLSRSPQEFWRRWHITLGDWCRNYVFLTAARLTRSPVVATFATFLAIGLWHQGTASLAVYGLINGAAVWLSVIVKRRGWLGALPVWLRAGLGMTLVQIIACVAAAFAFSTGGAGVPGALRILATAVGMG